MHRARLMRASGFFAFAFCVTVVHADGEAMRLPLDPAPLVIETGQGVAEFKVEVADDNSERARGLMFRERLPDGQAMLFVFGDDDIQNFWMHNTPQPLDIIYIQRDGTVESVHHAQALDDTPIPSGHPVRFVLEIAAGEAKRLGIVAGEHARHPLIDAAGKTP